MFSFLVGLQILTVLGCFGFVILMTRQRESVLSKLMLCIGFLGVIQNAGYLLELLSRDVGEAMIAVRVEFMGGAFITTFLFVFTAKYCGYRLSPKLEALMFCLDGLVLLCIWGYRYTPVYYSRVSFVTEGLFPHLILEKGPLHYLFLVQMIFHMVGSFVLTVQANRRVGKGKKNVNLMALGVCSIFPLLGFICNELQWIEGYDAVPACEGIGILAFGIVVIFYHIFDITITAHEDIIKSMDEAVLIVDADGGFLEANDKAKEIFQSLSRFKRGEQVCKENLKEVFAVNTYFEHISCNHIFEVHANKIWNNRVLVGYSIVFVDMTQSRKQLEQMKILKANAENANHAKSEFLARMSHEIRTPINAVLGMNEMVLRESTEEDVRKYSMDIKTSAHALLGIINDILDFSKIESGKMEIVPAEYEFNSMLNDLYNIFSLRAQEKGLRFDVSVDSSLPSKLYGDDIRIRQVLVNLMTNAVKYTRKGTVSFEVTGERDGADVILHYMVRDTGIGIRQEDIPKLFSAFERIDEEKNRNIEGTGLGMNISLQLLRLMQTELHVESVYGEGTRFFFALRQGVVDAEPIGSFQERARKAAKEHNYHASFTSPEGELLLVDDNRVNRRVFCGLLKQTQIKITDVGSGRECLDHIRQKKYDIIFLDHMMPEMDGMETMQCMREMEDNLCKETPVIMLTANAIMGAKEQYLAAGFDDFLAKPIDQTKLERLVMHWMPQEKIHSNT
ncbi:MAG: response regulator [Lachnospiraceae bacterium]|nr:response regulator [Lachnospiraceae bacterium]